METVKNRCLNFQDCKYEYQAIEEVLRSCGFRRISYGFMLDTGECFIYIGSEKTHDFVNIANFFGGRMFTEKQSPKLQRQYFLLSQLFLEYKVIWDETIYAKRGL